MGVTPLRCLFFFLQLEPRKERYTTRLVGLESPWKASETPPPTQELWPILGFRRRPPVGERKKKERNNTICSHLQLRSPGREQRRRRRRKREGGKSLSAAPRAETDRPAGPVRRAAASLATGDSGMGGGERGEGKENGTENWFQIVESSWITVFPRLISVQICFENWIRFQSMTRPTNLNSSKRDTSSLKEKHFSLLLIGL